MGRSHRFPYWAICRVNGYRPPRPAPEGTAAPSADLRGFPPGNDRYTGIPPQAAGNRLHPAVRQRLSYREAPIIKINCTGIRGFQSGDHTQQCGFPAARRPQERCKAAAVDLKRGRKNHGLPTEGFCDILKADIHSQIPSFITLKSALLYRTAILPATIWL